MLKPYAGQRIHLIGIGGIGMSALARFYKAQGAIVSGSDAAKSSITDSLRAEGIRITIGHKKSSVKKTLHLVVYNRAISLDNPELRAAEKMGIPTLPYAKALGKITETQSTVAITGSHGKSTTTALAALALIHGGLDPTVLIGTNLKEFGGKNFRRGHSWLVLEADDFGGAFFEYSPTVAIVTNIDREHMDFYKTFANVKNAFLQFLSTTRPGGVLILNRDDKTLYSLKSRVAAIAKKKNLRVIWYSTKNSPSANRLGAHIKKTLKIPGAHNVSNATAVYELGKVLKIPEKKILRVLGSYSGSWRRMEFRGNAKIKNGPHTAELAIYDDYAHHPTEIKATLQAFKEKFPHSPLICIYQPHQIERLRLLFNDFVNSFGLADILILIPVYQVKGREKGAKRAKNGKYTSEGLATAIKRKFPRKTVFYLPHPLKVNEFLMKKVTLSLSELQAPNSKLSPLVFMGAGDIVQYTDLIVPKRRTR